MTHAGTRSEPSRQRWNLSARWLALAGVIGPILFELMFTIAGLLRPGYSPIRQAVSDLGVGPNAWIQNANFVVFGLLLIAFAIGFYRGMRSVISGGWLMACLVLLILSGAGMGGAGYFTVPDPNDPPELQVLQGILHMLCFLAAFVSPAIALVIIGWRLRQDAKWRGYGRYSMITGLVALVLIALVFLFFAPGSPLSEVRIGGLVQRILALEVFAWHVVMGWRLFTLDGSR